jgi:ribonuclease HI
MAKSKFYTVWKGKKPGVYSTWADCEAQIKGEKGAQYKSFDNRTAAEKALKRNYWDFVQKGSKKDGQKKIVRDLSKFPEIQQNSLSVDAACAGNPGVMEYRGVETANGRQIFLRKFEEGTNNIGEFLALVHGLALLKKHEDTRPIYSDSRIAINWVMRSKRCKTQLQRSDKNAELFAQIANAERWLQQNSWPNAILKWETKKWGEIPADFGRK